MLGGLSGSSSGYFNASQACETIVGMYIKHVSTIRTDSSSDNSLCKLLVERLQMAAVAGVKVSIFTSKARD